jgi:hypothetical protein
MPACSSALGALGWNVHRFAPTFTKYVEQRSQIVLDRPGAGGRGSAALDMPGGVFLIQAAVGIVSRHQSVFPRCAVHIHDIACGVLHSSSHTARPESAGARMRPQ